MKHYFGSEGSKDYTLHDKNIKDKRKELYLNRHRKRENWTKSGIHTSGFWSRWILWNKPTINESIKDIEKKFNIKIINKIF
jgi:rhamnogalacturonyl hydrolase YesR